MIEKKQLGPITMNISDDRYTMSDTEVKELEDFINNDWMEVVPQSFQTVNYPMTKLGKPSILLRVDCSPDQLINGMYEVDANPYGLGLALYAGKSRVLDRYIYCLEKLGISAIKIKVYPSAEKMNFDAEAFKRYLKANGIEISDSAVHSQLWASNFDEGAPGFNEDLKISLMYSLESKLNLVHVGKAVFVSSLFSLVNSDDEIKNILLNKFSEGCVIKPIIGWGCGYKDQIGFRIVAAKKPYKQESDTYTAALKMIRQILREGKGREYLVQPFYPPRIVWIDGQPLFQIYRLYLVYNPYYGKYKFAGGWYHLTKSLRGHGTNDTISGWVEEFQHSGSWL